MLDLHDITVTVPDGEATLSILRGADLHVGAGEVVSVSGRSGSGKSTLLAIAGLLRRPQQGTVTLQGRDANAMSERERTRARRDLIGIIYQSAELFPSRSSSSNSWPTSPVRSTRRPENAPDHCSGSSVWATAGTTCRASSPVANANASGWPAP